MTPRVANESELYVAPGGLTYRVSQLVAKALNLSSSQSPVPVPFHNGVEHAPHRNSFAT